MNMNDQPEYFNDPQQEEKAHRIAALIAGYIHRSLTPSEHDELDQWVGQSDDNMQLFEELTDDRSTQDALDWLSDADGPRMLKKIKGGLEFARPRRSLFSQVWHYGIAASIAVLLGLGFMLFNKNSVKPIAKPALASKPQDVDPGREQATLTLADGTTISLDEAKNGTLATQGNSNITKQDGQIKYDAAGKSANAAVLNNIIATQRGGNYSLTLSDGTKAWLNAASSISYPAEFTGNERKVTISGEVYFEVASAKLPGANHNKPFIVEVKDRNMQVEVLGTHFNINSYTDESSVNTTLLEGVVKVSQLAIGNGQLTTDNKQLATGNAVFLKPGQQAQVQQGEIKTLTDVDTDVVMGWRNGVFRFKNDDVKTMMRQISRWYNVDVEFEGNVSTEGYSCALAKNTTLSILLDALEDTGVAHFKIEGKKIKVLP
jgi:ferric-dicitrate binding protein FerR (iron transport regulator)